jgi:hypothetical protein
MSNNLHTFSINEFIFTFGTTIVSGFAEGTFVNITMDAPMWTAMQGTDGEVCRVLRNKTMATITLTLLQTSMTNDDLTALMQADVSGNIPEPLVIKDLNGTTVALAAQCWIEKYSNTGFGDTAQTREWTIKAANLELFVGGNYS